MLAKTISCFSDVKLVTKGTDNAVNHVGRDAVEMFVNLEKAFGSGN